MYIDLPCRQNKLHNKRHDVLAVPDKSGKRFRVGSIMNQLFLFSYIIIPFLVCTNELIACLQSQQADHNAAERSIHELTGFTW